MSRLGMGSMLSMLGGNEETVNAHKSAMGKKIKSIRIDDDYNGGDGGLEMLFDDGTGIWIYDDARSCCENRYLHTDDKVSDFAWATFIEAELREGGEKDDGWETHEWEFVVIKTSLGEFTLETHNKHNGYYGGFYVKIRNIKGESNGN